MRTLCAVIQWISAAVEHARWQPPDETMFLDTEHIERGKDPVEIARCRDRSDTLPRVSRVVRTLRQEAQTPTSPF